ncbi:uncharacterized protein LOC118742326 [Rhagoletis pomonella]|uniref:uncharacterized protein LOC118742326 n=1 Tax=Rhagoletis pomonella TaxID=28610 RepID=UPI001783136F|nr:uncharacterized protein LOC118742326 [Rhagoletis pomonella]
METLKVVLKTQNELIEGINIINHNQTTIVQNQIQISEVLEQVQQNAVNKSEMEAQNMMLRECKVVAKKIERSVCRMTGEISDKNLDDIASSLPLQSDCAVDLMETKLRDPEYAQAMATYIIKLKGVSEDVGSVIKHLFTDETLLQFNWDGRWERKPLNKLILVDTILRDAYNKKGAVELEKDIKKAVELSHHRLRQTNFLTKKSKNTSSGNL